MNFQIASIALALSIACLSSADAYAPASLLSRPSPAFVVSSGRIQPKAATRTRTTRSQLFSQWDEDDDEEDESAVVGTTPSYEEAEKAVADEDDKAAMDDMGDFDAAPSYNPNDIDKYREAIKKRTEALGMEKKTPEEIAMEEAMKAASQGNAGDSLAQQAESETQSPSQMLDLSQITDEAPRGPDENLPAMLYNPADDMTQEEMEEADPTALLPWPQQVAWVFEKSEFPSALSALTETIILVVTVSVTGFVITQWDELMREAAFNWQSIPRPEEVASSMEGMIMPDDPVLGMGGNSMSGGDMLKMLQEGAQETLKAAKDGTIKDILSGDVPQDL